MRRGEEEVVRDACLSDVHSLVSKIRTEEGDGRKEGTKQEGRRSVG